MTTQRRLKYEIQVYFFITFKVVSKMQKIHKMIDFMKLVIELIGVGSDTCSYMCL